MEERQIQVCVCVSEAGEAGEVSGGWLLLQVRTEQLICNDMRVRGGRETQNSPSFIFTEERVDHHVTVSCDSSKCTWSVYCVTFLKERVK